MSVESERQDENRSDEQVGGTGARAGSSAERAGKEHAVQPVQRHRSLNQRLRYLQAETLAKPAQVAEPQTVGRPTLHFPPLDQLDEPLPRRPANWPVRGLLFGLGGSLIVGLLVLGWVKRVELLTAWQSSPKSTIDLYPPREAAPDARRVTVTVAETRPGPSRPLQVAVASPSSGPEVSVASLDSATSGPCGAAVGQPEPGLVELRLADTSRSGSALLVRVDDIDYRGQFAGDGSLSLVAPRLSRAAAIRWAGGDGRPCTIAVPDADAETARLRVALVWEGAASLGLHILEPQAWVGSPRGDISAETPNDDLSHGAGRIRTFGSPGDPARVTFYSVDLARLGPPGVLNALVKLQPSTEMCTSPGQTGVVRYQLHTGRTGPGAEIAAEVRAYAFQLPACGQEGSNPPAERIAIKF
jgi:hypothetical protein